MPYITQDNTLPRVILGADFLELILTTEGVHQTPTGASVRKDPHRKSFQTPPHPPKPQAPEGVILSLVLFGVYSCFVTSAGVSRPRLVPVFVEVGCRGCVGFVFVISGQARKRLNKVCLTPD